MRNLSKNISINKRRERVSMSYMVMLKNKEGTVIMADSRLSKNYKGKMIYDDNFHKVFAIPEKHLIWGVVGYYGYEESLLNKINDQFKKEEYGQAIINIKNMSKEVDDGYITNIFVSNGAETRVIDLGNNFINDIIIHETDSIYTAGAHNYSQNIYNLSDLHNKHKYHLYNYAKDMIEKEKQIDEYINSLIPQYKQSICGNVEGYFISKDWKVEKI